VIIPDVNFATFARFAAIGIATNTCSFRATQRGIHVFGDSQEGGVNSRDKDVADEDSKDDKEDEVFHVNQRFF